MVSQSKKSLITLHKKECSRQFNNLVVIEVLVGELLKAKDEESLLQYPTRC